MWHLYNVITIKNNNWIKGSNPNISVINVYFVLECEGFSLHLYNEKGSE